MKKFEFIQNFYKFGWIPLLIIPMGIVNRWLDAGHFNGIFGFNAAETAVLLLAFFLAITYIPLGLIYLAKRRNDASIKS